MVVVVLYAAAPLLARLAYLQGVIVVGAVALAVTAAFFPLSPAACGASGDWRELAGSLAFAALATGLLAWYFYMRNRAFSPALSEARLQALQARIRPHFLFNSLNAVLSLMRKDPKRAEARWRTWRSCFAASWRTTAS